VRVRDHILVSTAGAGLLAPWIGRDAIGLWLGSVLLDADHYMWFCANKRRVSPRAAVRFFNEARAPQHQATRALHSPLAFVFLAGSVRRRRLLPVAVGVALHVSIDAFHDARMARARAAALRRDGFRCQDCGVQGPNVGTHLRRQPRLLPSYRSRNLVALCDPCHEAAHMRRNGG
jgi:hypothetical protein